MQNDTMLGGYRVLDLTEGGYLLGGQILGDLGADVIKLEPPGGSPSREVGPFYKDMPEREKSLFWFSYNRNKRGITLDLEKADDREIFKRLVKTADIVLESYPTGYLKRLGLGYSDLVGVKADIILTSVTPYGQEGPKANYQNSDLTTWAASMIHSMTGDPDKPPVWSSYPSTGFVGGILGVIGSLFALWNRETTGEGQHVDAPVQQYLLQFTTGAHWFWECMQFSMPRLGRFGTLGFTKIPSIRPCKDGFIHCMIGGGAAAGLAGSTASLVKWMDEENMATDRLKKMDWLEFGTEATEMNQEQMDEFQVPFDKFILSKTSAEFSEEAVKRGIMGCPVSNSREIWEDEHLKARNFWKEVEHPELKDTLNYCGPFVQFSEAPMGIARRAPLIGEHNREILEEELELKEEETVRSKKIFMTRKEDSAKQGSIFAGIRILDFGTAATVPLALAWMGDYGATVIKIETHLRPDMARAGGPFYNARFGELDQAGWQQWLNPSKYSLTLNLEKPGGKELIKRLITEWQPHIMAEAFRPGVMKRLGLDYETVKQLKPDIVYWSSCLEGQYGPHSQRIGYGSVSTNLCGVSHLTGWPDRPPAGMPLAYGDFASTGTGLLSIVSALFRQKKTRKGVHIDQSQYEVNVHILAGAIMEYLVNGRILGRNGNRLDYAAPHGVYPCEGNDRWVAVAVLTEDQWAYFRKAIGNPQWAEDSKFATLAERKDNEDELDKLVGEWTIGNTAEQVETLLQKNGVAANVVENAEDIYKDPQIQYYRHFREFDHPEIGKVRSEIPPLKFSKSTDVHFRAPLLGEHNQQVLSEFLGLSDDEISDLYVEGIVTSDADLPGESEDG
ncbi:MAG: CoA transferase [Proteobacteria bacterium]|nr:CoA transferase [Pseudomonadota bacterium]